MPPLHRRRTASILVASILIAAVLLGASLATARTVVVYNSEEHQLIVDRGVALVEVPASVKLPANVTFGPIDAEAYRDFAENAKTLAAQQDACYHPIKYGQKSANEAIYVAAAAQVPAKILQIAGYTDASAATGSPFTLGQLAALYGDYRRTTYCDGTGRCFLTQQDVKQITFQGGNWKSGCPGATDAGQYLQAIGSGLNPPAGPVGDIAGWTANSVNDRWEAGWWGDEMLRMANINDWHFSKGAVAFYTGAHRLALLYADSARRDPKYWVKALHLEASALHSLTDLFAFGHVVTNRDSTSGGIMLVNEPTPGTGTKWMNNVLKLGGGSRNTATGIITLSSTLPAIAEVAAVRNDFIDGSRGKWWDNAKSEHTYHGTFNSTGAHVKNLNGNRFLIYGDAKLGATIAESATLTVMAEAVHQSVQSLFTAYDQLVSGANVETIGAKGSAYFAALKYIPVYISTDEYTYFTGRWTLYAKVADEIAGTNKVPGNWANCMIPYLRGSDWGWPDKQGDKACTTF